MLEEIFTGNIVVGLIITIIAISAYSNFEENQQMSLIYLVVYGLSFFKTLRIWLCVCFLFVASFAFLEYLTQDKKKLELVTSFFNKILDYFYLMVFQLNIFTFILSLFFLFVSHILSGWLHYGAIIISIVLLCYGEHSVITQPFKVRNISGICKPFEKNPYYLYQSDYSLRSRFELLCDIEDKTYFYRRKSYSIFSIEYFREDHVFKKIIQRAYNRIRLPRSKQSNSHFFRNLLSRGYSTPEMQLIRTIGVVRGYEKYKYSRKVYEIIYSRIFFKSLKKYQENNSNIDTTSFREYLIDVYVKTVLIKVNKKRIPKLCNIFENENDVSTWPMEGLFIACLGLSFRRINEYQLSLYQDVISRHNLNKSKIYEYSRMIDQGDKIPCTNAEETR